MARSSTRWAISTAYALAMEISLTGSRPVEGNSSTRRAVCRIMYLEV